MKIYNNIPDTLRYKLTRFISKWIKVDPKYNDYSYELGNLTTMLEEWRQLNTRLWYVINTKPHRVGMQNSTYVSLVSSATESAKRLEERVKRIQTELYLGLANGKDLFREMTQNLTLIRSLVSTIEYSHEMHEPIEDTSRDTTESGEVTGVAV